jgi:Flp pilus assembly protein TadB
MGENTPQTADQNKPWIDLAGKDGFSVFYLVVMLGLLAVIAYIVGYKPSIVQSIAVTLIYFTFIATVWLLWACQARILTLLENKS